MKQQPIPIYVPYITGVIDHHIYIRGLPDTPVNIHNTELNRLCHRIKRLWDTGDRLGKAAYVQRQTNGWPIEAMPCRVNFVYTLTRVHHSKTDGCYTSQPGDVRLGINLNCASTATPYWVDSVGSLTFPLSRREQEHAIQQIISMYVAELTAYFQRAASDVPPGVRPDFWDHPLPHIKCGPELAPPFGNEQLRA